MAVRYLNASGTQYLINQLKAKIAVKANQTTVENMQLRIDNLAAAIPTKVSELTNDVPYLDETAANDIYFGKTAGENLQTVAQQLTEKVAILNGDETVMNSVDWKISRIPSISTQEITDLW